MLTEIICDRFREKKITFSNGLNVIIGDGSNSIGKSTLLWVIDFVFGGSGFTEKNKFAIQKITDHEYCFSFTFSGNEKHYFKRGTKYSKDIYVCDEKYVVKSTMGLDDYKKFLKSKYIPQLTDLNFREFVGTFSRIWGRGNDEIAFDLKPLQVHPSDSTRDCLVRLIKIFNQYEMLHSLLSDKENKEKQLKAIKKLFGTDFLPPNIKKSKYDDNTVEIRKITDEVQNIKQDLAAFSLSIRDVIDKEIIQLKEEKDSLLNYKFELSNKRNRLQHSLTTDKRFKTNSISELQEILPNVDVNKLAQIEAFHNNIFDILSREIKTELNNADEELCDLDSRIDQINQEISNKLQSVDMPTVLVDRVYDLALGFSKLKSENDLYEKQHNLSVDIKNLTKNIDAMMEDKLSTIASKINSDIYKTCQQIYGQGYKSPVFKANSNNYSYENRDNTGAGAKALSLIVFDMAILKLTNLPILIHDSRLYDSLENRAICDLLPYYDIPNKQTFIALESIDTLSEDAQKLARKKSVISLSSTFTLYDIIWKESKKEER